LTGSPLTNIFPHTPSYGVVTNLSSHDRYITNTFLLGAIRNMEREPSSLNSFLVVLVDKLIEGYEGWPIIVQGDTVPTLFKVALVQICSDLPAARKACGFFSHIGMLSMQEKIPRGVWSS
jgi:hypothetical protein